MTAAFCFWLAIGLPDRLHAQAPQSRTKHNYKIVFSKAKTLPCLNNLSEKKDFSGNFDKCFFNEIGVLKYFVIKKSLKIVKSKN